MARLSYADLVARLSDLERLAEPPHPEERGGCRSSYDRRSRYNPATGLYEHWDANRDGDGYIRREGDRIVAFDEQGPGVIWRIWSAAPGPGHAEIYIDGHAVPVMDLPFQALFGGVGLQDYNLPELAMTLSRGHNRYIPIPYNRSCKIRLAPDWGRYYHITYSRLPQGTELPVFTGEREDADRVLLAQKDRELARRGWSLPVHADDERLVADVTLTPGRALTVATLEGNRAITGLRVVPGAELRQDARDALRELAFAIRWDGERQPSVWSPLGDFFGAAPGIQPFRALPVGMTPDFFYSHWFMPFARQAELRLHNEGAKTRALRLEIVSRPLVRDANALLRFHAKWHRDAALEKSQRNGRDIDWPLLHAQGPGRFCGMHLHVWNCWRQPVQAPSSWWYGAGRDKTVDWWWGEGDEKFFVDGEAFPSTFGTGSEDYVGYAWAAEPPFARFDSAFACQPYTELDGNGHTSVNRFHICDDIPFQKSFEGCLEKYKGNRWGEGNACLYHAVAYWYQAAGRPDAYAPVPVTERVGHCAEPD